MGPLSRFDFYIKELHFLLFFCLIFVLSFIYLLAFVNKRPRVAEGLSVWSVKKGCLRKTKNNEGRTMRMLAQAKPNNDKKKQNNEIKINNKAFINVL